MNRPFIARVSAQLAVAFLSVLAISAAAFAGTRSYAIIVGIDTYSGTGFADLAYAERDARAIARYFNSQDYEVTLLLGSSEAVTKQRIFDAADAIARRIDGDDRFVFSFSGHGTVEEEAGVKVGYLLAEGPSYEAAKLSAREIRELGQTLDQARHQLFIFASCYGGLLGQLPRRSVRGYDSTEHMLEDLMNRRARHFLSAGGGDQQVLDSGPAGLSWFTYFLLKALEPNVLSGSSDGIVRFSDWASYVQAYSANPYHTPAFGTLAGHEGGQFLPMTTDKGRPRVPPLPDIRASMLADLGFLSRGKPDLVRASIADMRDPIDSLYRAWEDLDLQAYMAQFDPRVVQTGRYKNGRTYRRGYEEIHANRAKLFPRLRSVDVENYEVMFQGVDKDTVRFAVTYSMSFYFRNGRVIQERNIKECYRIRRNGDRWRIIENNDYEDRLCGT